ncbi:hypothetical protein CPB85DRAFT_1429066 [Mucidula mucida]|nr:hypothetical protein CPB85DRAFT_1429066 [Mucidula mucida]
MYLLSEEQEKQLLVKEWAVKIDTLKSTPYLIKFFSSQADSSCTVLITDTKFVWTEALSSQQFARRWRESNNLDRVSSTELSDEEEEWRIHNLEVLTKAHSPGGIADLSFEVVETNFSDIAFTLEGPSFQWRWEACFVGHKSSAEILSKHLILPLISMSHLAFSSAENVNGLSDADMEKAIDKVARTSRRNIDLHVRNAFSKPRVATGLARMTATLNFASDIPPVKSNVDAPDLEPLPPPATEHASTSRLNDALQPSNPTLLDPVLKAASPLPSPPPPPAAPQGSAPVEDSDSATEDDDDEDEPAQVKAKSPSPPPKPSSSLPAKKRATAAPLSDTDSSPIRPPKKAKAPVSSSEDSDDDRKKPIVKRGTRQPIKRGGKRF